MPREYNTDRCVARFWSHVDRNNPNGCWLWTGVIDNNGYGRFDTRTHPDPNMRGQLAHRFSYALHHGAIPNGMLVCHNCPDGDNPRCVNPAHCFTGTIRNNIDDMVAKGRQNRGELITRAKLTAADVLDIRRRYDHRGVSIAALASEYRFSWNGMSDVVTRRTWKHI